jgi:glycosyltransferase involved in cell wall biosynthesis
MLIDHPKTRPHLSVIAPLYNEEDNVDPLYEALTTALDPIGMDYEMVLVDDGSKDSTLAKAIQIAQNDPRVKVLETIDSGYDIVVGWRFQRQDKLITRKIPSKIANWLIAKVTKVPIKDNGCSLKAYRAAVIKHIPLYSEMHRFIPAMASIAAPRIAEVKARHHARRFGKSKYGLSRIYKVLLDMLVIKTLASFASSPLLWFGMLAIPLLLAGTGLLGYVFMHTLLVGAPISLPIAGCGVIFLTSAFMMVCSGALGELVYNLGDMRDHEFARLTQQLRMRPAHVETQPQ